MADDVMRSIAMRFGTGSLVALGLIVGTGIAMASHFSLWSSDTLQLKLLVLVLVVVLAAFHILVPRIERSATRSRRRRSACSGSA